VLLIVGWLVSGAVFGTWYMSKKAARDFQFFDVANMRGVIIGKFASGGGERFRLDNLPQQFTFQSRATMSNGRRFFNSSAEIGDSVVKPAGADVLTLIKATTHEVILAAFRTCGPVWV
jgi:hypothetical protein